MFSIFLSMKYSTSIKIKQVLNHSYKTIIGLKVGA